MVARELVHEKAAVIAEVGQPVLRSASFKALNTHEHIRIPRDYKEARKDFLDAAKKVGAEIKGYAIEARGPDGDELTVDFARYGPANAKNVIISLSGVHGVEGYIGSAIQREFLLNPSKLPPDTAIIFCHALNPWGFAHNRRTDNLNVDNNRNLPLGKDGYNTPNEGYASLANLFSPKVETYVPGKLRFYSSVLPKIATGYRRAKQALMKGQFTHPQGLYYGGTAQVEGIKIFLSHMQSELKHAQNIYGDDIHSGLGKFGKSTLLLAKGSDPTKLPILEAAHPHCKIAKGLDKSVVGVEVVGSIGAAMGRIFSDKNVFWFAQEAGTYGELTMLRKLQEENVAWKSGVTDPKHPTRLALVEAFCPEDPEWRRQVIGDGVELIDTLLKMAS